MNAEYPNPVGEPNRERVQLCPEWTGKKDNQISLLSLLVTCTWLYSKGSVLSEVRYSLTIFGDDREVIRWKVSPLYDTLCPNFISFQCAPKSTFYSHIFLLMEIYINIGRGRAQ